MANYTYDESGVTFFYFALTIASLVVVPSTLLLLRSKVSGEVKTKTTTLKFRTRKTADKSGGFGIKYILLAIGWILIALLSYQVKNKEVVTGPKWDPYEILGLETGADFQKIKKSFKKLSLKYHPDKIRGTDEEKVKAEAFYIDITRAYKTLTDDVSRENYEKYGNPDGLMSRTMGIALPRILVEAHTSPFVMMLYGLFFGFVLPYYVGRWWYRSNQYTKDKILNPTMSTFFKNIREPISLPNLIDLLCAAEEFNTDGLEFVEGDRLNLLELEKKVQEAMQRIEYMAFKKSEKYHTDSQWKAKVLLHCHFLRVEVNYPDLAEQQLRIVEKSIHLVSRGLVQISNSQTWASCTAVCINIIQMLVQGVYEFAPPLLQIPYIDFDKFQELQKNHGLYGTFQTKKLLENGDDKLIASFGEHKDTIVKSIMSVPEFTIARTLFTVIGDRVITPLSIVSLIVDLKLINPPENSPKPDPMVSKISSMLSTVSDTDCEKIEDIFGHIQKLKAPNVEAPEATAPYLAARKLSNWWFILYNPQNYRTVIPPVYITDLTSEKILVAQFQAPHQPGSYDFNILVMSDSYIGCNVQHHMKLVVANPSVLPPEPEYEDDISEPEENSLAAQMRDARSKSAQHGAGGNADYDSSDED
ncbi:Translocation protein sec63 [Zancudomyces culisetae]|uniref:Translocation protein sec63 n=1 Tax=Zancudomyces culisetae TaxID=1213189 RepID=A0A1R1PJ70_ZANCU|nr:Translocation protein sec63 [Zancudomyces culisetae]|eukprot:OMH80953.1 Translocation protein sec63 [Zancudomyces culisetae]